MRVYIVTGTTRGIGRAIAETITARKDLLLSLSSAPHKQDPLWHNVTCDLSRTEGLGNILAQLLKAISPDEISDLVLINNAGILAPMGPMEEAPEEQIVRHLLVNQAAPAILMSAFIRLTADYCGQRRIINISSGAAKHPYEGWAMYCAAKSALDMMTRCVAAEQRRRHKGVSVCAVYPGKVDTGMQRIVRQADPAVFPAQPDFALAHQQGQLLSSHKVARMIIDLDNDGEFKNGGIYDLRSVIKAGRAISIVPIANASVDQPIPTRS